MDSAFRGRPTEGASVFPILLRGSSIAYVPLASPTSPSPTKARFENVVMSLSAPIAERFRSIFRHHGHFCASHPWEVILVTFTLTAFVLSMGFVLPQSRVACSQLVACQTGATEEVSARDERLIFEPNIFVQSLPRFKVPT